MVKSLSNPILGSLLAGASLLYRLGLRGIQWSYQAGILEVHRLPVPVISVGNLTWGGTGKTPMVMKLAKTLKDKGRTVAVLTRGYGRDEAKLLDQRLAPIPVLVGADRVASGQRAVEQFKADLLLLDDGYQQWRLKKDLEILMVDATTGFGNGHLIPRGNLREPMSAVRRADLIVLAKADLNPNGVKRIEKTLRVWNRRAPIYTARYRPVQFTNFFTGQEIPLGLLKGQEVCSLAGIANPASFESTLERLGVKLNLRFRFGDHHPYTAADLARIFSRCRHRQISKVVTTSKDAIRILGQVLERTGLRDKGVELLILEIEMELGPYEEEFLHRIDSVLGR